MYIYIYIFLKNGVTCVTCYILLVYAITFAVTKCYVLLSVQILFRLVQTFC